MGCYLLTTFKLKRSCEWGATKISLLTDHIHGDFISAEPIHMKKIERGHSGTKEYHDKRHRCTKHMGKFKDQCCRTVSHWSWLMRDEALLLMVFLNYTFQCTQLPMWRVTQRHIRFDLYKTTFRSLYSASWPFSWGPFQPSQPSFYHKLKLERILDSSL